jgi:hypothetical protein
MRTLADASRLRRFFRELARATNEETAVYVTGGTTAVLIGWRETTVDADITFEPEQDALFRAIARLKDELQINVEIASPAHFIPELPGWRERCRFIVREGAVSYFHYDPYAQALAKIERGHAKDLADVEAMAGRGLVEPARMRELFAAIEPQLYRYPHIDPKSFAARLAAVLAPLA